MIFQSEDNLKKLIISFQYNVDNYLTFSIKVKSCPFSGKSSFCLSKETVVSTIDKLSEMHENLEGTCDIKDYDTDACLTIKMKKLGNLFIEGQIGGSHQDHFMKFKYIADQTILLNLINVLKTALSVKKTIN
ncbi:hypothetical protein GF322_02110 [Candidatus Dependentiae bacterium]|nr:hypothetical protein [Candidatus Dependentiae bacterium]